VWGVFCVNMESADSVHYTQPLNIASRVGTAPGVGQDW
jgi:hypothetical protein